MIIAAIPAYNEENTIAKVLVETANYADKIIVADDGSTDLTTEIADRLGAHVVRHEKNLGYGAAIKTCFTTARSLDVDVLITLDADGQHDPDEIPIFLESLNKHKADVVIGSRFITKTGEIPMMRKIGIRFLNFITNKVGDIEVSDSQSGFRAYSRKAIESINPTGDNMGVASEILLDLKKMDLKVIEIPISCSYDIKKKPSMDPLTHGWSVLSAILRVFERRDPLRLFGIFGGIFLAVGFIMGGFSLQVFTTYDYMPFGPTIATMFFVLIGLFLVLTGVVLHYIKRLFEEVIRK